MSDLLGMAKAIEKLLLENAIKNISNFFKVNDRITISTSQGVQTYLVRGRPMNIGKIEGLPVSNDKSNKPYFIDIDSYDGKKINLYQPKIKEDGTKTFAYLPIDNIVGFSVTMPKYGIKGKHIEDITANDFSNPQDNPEEAEDNPEEAEDLASDKDEYSQVLNTADKEDIIAISVDFPKEGTTRNQRDYESENELDFVVRKAHGDTLEVNLSRVEGGKSGALEKKFNEKLIIIDKKESLYVENGQLKMRVAIKGNNEKPSMFSIPHISYLGVNKLDGKVGLDGEERDDKTLSQDALLRMINGDEHVNQMYNKQPSIRDAIMGASPTGLYQIAKILKGAKLDNAYFKINSKIQFRIKNNDLIPTYRASDRVQLVSLKWGSVHVGRMIRDRVMMVGKAINNTHWEIEIKEEVKKNQYRVIYSHCKHEGSCTVWEGLDKDGFIEIMDINYNKK